MKKVLFTWMGEFDLDGPLNEKNGMPGPIAQVLGKMEFSHVVILSDYKGNRFDNFKKWLCAKAKSEIFFKEAKLPSPTNFEEIYKQASKAIIDFHSKHGKDFDRAFLISPGTQAMGAVWVILSRTRFPADLIQSFKKEGREGLVETIDFAFEFSSKYVEELLYEHDKEFIKLSQGYSPSAPQFGAIIHRSEIMKRLIAKAQRASIHNYPVLILGESGTGKELFAKAIHKASMRNSASFIAFNCGAIPENLIEAELFGYDKGAFTGADKSKKGYIEEANGGTLFLDEIGDCPKLIQLKLLRVLQEQEIVHVGATKPVKVDVRIISATNKDLIEEVRNNNFREDLFYRLAVIMLKIPPLRERTDDMDLLIEYFLTKINDNSKRLTDYKNKIISASAKKIMKQHNWPGNIRELENTLNRATALSFGIEITEQDIKEAIINFPSQTAKDILNLSLDKGFDINNLIDEFKQLYIDKALKTSGGNIVKAANLLGLKNYQTLSQWVAKYKMSDL